MRFFSFCIGFFCVVLFLSACSSATQPFLIVPLGDELITIEAPHGFEVFFDSGATYTARDYYISGSTVINGSYFGQTDSGVYYPAGLWQDGVTWHSDIAHDDPNLTHIVGVAGSGISILENTRFKENAGPYQYALQAGPLVLSGNTLQDFGQSWHARESHERTLIGKTKTGKVYFFVSRKQISLTRAGEIIASNPIFQSDPITVLNLDGGPSTAYFDGVRGYRENKKLPIFFRINP